ncbi:MAG: ATP-binding cassette domain-containing protein [Bacteroidota bacterium]
MSEEILKALTQLFAIITKQDGGVTENEREFVINFFRSELDQESIKGYLELYDDQSGYKTQGSEENQKVKLTSVKDAQRTLAICKKINSSLTQKQKVVVLIKLLELVVSDNHLSPQRMAIINTVSTVFNIVADEYKLIETFVISMQTSEMNFSDILVVDSGATGSAPDQKHAHIHIGGHLVFMRVSSVDMYFAKYLGSDANVLNSFVVQPNRVYLFSHGSTIKTQNGDALYYSDLVADFNQEIKTTKLSFNANIEEFKFPNGAVGLRDVHISEGPGKLIGIMGASGAGKTTLLNVLAGLEKPGKGSILINGFDIHEQKDEIQGVIGYVSQDDLLIEELTVYQNLYYNARLCFANFTEEQINHRVMEVLENLGLDQRKDLKVGNPLEKTISGGQRKRLNIALELIREPAVMFLDEPTSGLSSRDSENVIDLLKELSLKGKLIFVVIHQPSSDIYKMFDKMVIMDVGGYPAYYGHPVEAITYFKKATLQADSNRGQCETCGNVNPEQIFNIIEAKVVDEYGEPTNKRKIAPQGWHEMFRARFKMGRVEDLKEKPPQTLNIPGKIKQATIFTTRDLLSKLSNKQYLLINLLEAPLLAIILAFIIRYRSAPGGTGYSFRFNENFPAYILMSIIVALFMGLTVSAEEIIRDRKILRRESFLNLSWNSYLVSKLIILFTLSALQTLMFAIVGNLILEVKGMTLPFWLVLFTTSCFANVLGLNVSSAFKNAVTVYIMIPLLLIPQMILSGLLFNFDKLNSLISTKGKVPLVADMMASRWAYEAMAVYQFKFNGYEREYYEYEQNEAKADFKAAYLADDLIKRNNYVMENFESKDDSVKRKVAKELAVIRNTLAVEEFREGLDGIDLETYSQKIGTELTNYLINYKRHYQKAFNESTQILEKKMAFVEKQGHKVADDKNEFYNESLADLVTNATAKQRLVEYNDHIIQEINPVFQEPSTDNPVNYRTAFFYPDKNFLGMTVGTFGFDLLVIWSMSIVFYVALYFELFRKLIAMFGKFKPL